MNNIDANSESYFLNFIPSPISPLYSTIHDPAAFAPENDYAALSSFDNMDAYISPPYINDFIPQDHMMPPQKSYSEPNLMLNPSFLHLSREQLIKRVVQLEMEKTIPANEFIINEQHNIHSCLWVNCRVKASTLENLMIHICEQHIGSGKAIYFCEWKDCIRNKKPFMKRHKMHNHMRTHTGERPFICTVIGCNKTFSRPDSLSTHIKTHSDIRPYLCSVPGCEKAYFHSRSLRKHVKSCHLKSTTTTTTSIATTATTAGSVHRSGPITTEIPKKNKPMIQSAVNSITSQFDHFYHPYPRY